MCDFVFDLCDKLVIGDVVFYLVVVVIGKVVV